MLLEPARSPYDLNFQLFGTPVRISPWFWLVSVIFGWGFVNQGQFDYLAMWVLFVFVSILLHEFGHIWAGRAFGSDGTIVLYSFGGLAIGSNTERYRWQRIVVSLAGPGIQLAFYGLLAFERFRRGPAEWEKLPERVQDAFEMLRYINLYWALFNLVPVWPLDGGQVSREVCIGASPRNGYQVSLRISIVVALVLAVHAIVGERGSFRIPYLPTGVYVAILFGALAFESYQLLARSAVWNYEPPDDRVPWER